MSVIDRLRRFLNPKPRLTYGHSNISPDPSKVYEFFFLANFPDQRSAELCRMALDNLTLSPNVKDLANGRWNAEFTYVGKADPEVVTRISEAIREAALRQGGELALTTVGQPRPNRNNAA